MSRTKALSCVREAREKKGLSREQLAKKVKVGPAYIGGIEGGSLAHSISPRVREAIVEALGRNALPESLMYTHNKKVRAYVNERRAAAKKAEKKEAAQSLKSIPTTEKKSASKAAPKAAKFDPAQAFLPGFLDHVDASVQEWARQLIQERLQKALENALVEIKPKKGTA